MPTIERSPRYPAYPLGEAISFARMLYTHEKRSVAPIESVGRALGHEMLSGTARVKIGTLRQYGLVEDAGRKKVRLSDRGFTILMKPSAEKYREAVMDALTAPPLFQSIQANYPEASDQTLRYHLMHDLKFSEDGADRAIQAYRESVAFANPDEIGYDLPGNADLSSREWDQKPPPDASRKAAEAPPSQRGGGKLAVSYTWPLPDETDAQVSFTQRPTRRGIERLIAYLQFMKEDLPQLSSAGDRMADSGTQEAEPEPDTIEL